MNTLLLVQGFYFFTTGVWSLVHISSFQKVTGPKTDLWLVKTVGVLVVAIGGGLILSGIQQQTGPGLILIAITSAFGLLAIDLVYVYKRTISPVYLLDAALETGLLIWWAICLLT